MADLEPLHVALRPNQVISISAGGVSLDEALPQTGALPAVQPKPRRPPPDPPTKPGGSPVVARYLDVLPSRQMEILDSTDAFPEVSLDELTRAVSEGRPIIFDLPK